MVGDSDMNGLNSCIKITIFIYRMDAKKHCLDLWIMENLAPIWTKINT